MTNSTIFLTCTFLVSVLLYHNLDSRMLKYEGSWSNGLVVKELDSQSRVPDSKPLGGSKVDSAFHPPEVD